MNKLNFYNKIIEDIFNKIKDIPISKDISMLYCDEYNSNMKKIIVINNLNQKIIIQIYIYIYYDFIKICLHTRSLKDKPISSIFKNLNDTNKIIDEYIWFISKENITSKKVVRLCKLKKLYDKLYDNKF